jgi:virginiamycin B lyase
MLSAHGFLPAALAASVAAAQVSIREFELPTRNALPHDPAAAPDGSLWFTEQKANKLGRLDPKTGQIREYPLATADSGPHGLVADRDGGIWFTANYKGYLGKLDPKTGKVIEFAVPLAGADPHTPAIDARGRVWFTMQQANRVGRLDPRSGSIDLREVPTRDSKPYGIVIGARGMPVFCEFGSNKLATIDPETMAIREHTLPDGARPRRLALAPDGSIYYSDYARGYLGRFDPATGNVEEWPSPGGRSSRPYGIASAPDGTVWFSESGLTPNTLVRFDPRTRQFSSSPIPSGGGVVRNMVSTVDGHLYLACSGVNKVAIVEPGGR